MDGWAKKLKVMPDILPSLLLKHTQLKGIGATTFMMLASVFLSDII
jgi:hypothetical protein